MHAIITAGVVSTMTLFSPPVSPERIQELVKKLEEPTRSQSDPSSAPATEPSPKFNYRWHIKVQGELRLAGDAAVEPLLALLNDKTKSGHARAQAATVLIEKLVGTKVKPDQRIIDAVNAALKDSDPSLRYGLLTWLPRYGLAGNIMSRNIMAKAAVEAWIKRKPRTPYDAIEMVYRMGLAEDRSFTINTMDAFLPAIVTLVSDPDPEIAASAAHTIRMFGRQAGRDALLQALKHKDIAVSNEAAHSLSLIWSTDVDVAKAVIAMLDATKPLQQYACLVRVVGNFGPIAKAAVPDLIRALNYTRNHPPTEYELQDVHDNAARSLGLIGPPAKEAIPDLLRCMASNYYPADSVTAVYIGNKEVLLVALEKIDAEAGSKARVQHQRKLEEYYRWLDSLSRRPPNEPRIVPELQRKQDN
ncbi:MAG: HEAT repeat domain-containing protein [Gemmataceae bacterium]